MFEYVKILLISSSSFPVPCYLPVLGSSVHLLNPFLSFANLSISLIEKILLIYRSKYIVISS